MNKADLLARNVGSITSYMKLYKDSLKPFKGKEKQLLTDLVLQLDSQMDNTKTFHKLKWKFAKIDVNIENGWPHTIGDTIVVSDAFFKQPSDNQLITLLHEQIHVYQRSHPIETDILIRRYWKYEIYDIFDKYDTARNNPDINNFVYGKDGKVILQVYKHNEPTSISESFVIALPRTGSTANNDSSKQIQAKDIHLPDVILQYEHPYEIMASFIPLIVLQSYNDTSEFTMNTKVWLSKYL
jgi:hypothetical protein